MKDKNGVGVMIGDTLANGPEGAAQTDIFHVTRLQEERGRAVGISSYGIDDGCAPAHWTVIRRADGSAPSANAGTNCDGCGAPGATTKGVIRGKPGVACAKCAARAKYRGKPFDRVYESGESTMTFCGVTVHVTSEPLPGGGMLYIQERASVPTAACIDELSWSLAAISRPVEIDRAERDEWMRERYAAFRETVERVVEEQAPRATLVTDVVGKRQEQALAWLSQGDATVEAGHVFDDDDSGDTPMKCASRLVWELGLALGAREMGGGK